MVQFYRPFTFPCNKQIHTQVTEDVQGSTPVTVKYGLELITESVLMTEMNIVLLCE